MRPISPTSLLSRKRVCPDCGRGWHTNVMNSQTHFVYRREDLANIQHFNVTWEWFDEPPSDSKPRGGPKFPWGLETPKVLNLLRGKTKNEQNTKVAAPRQFGSKAKHHNPAKPIEPPRSRQVDSRIEPPTTIRIVLVHSSDSTGAQRRHTSCARTS